MSELKSYTFEEISKHNTHDDLWIVYNGKVYDVGQYIDEHPGGEEVILDCGGQDATEAFDDIGHSEDAHEILEGLLIGTLEGGVVKESKKSASATSTESGVSTPLIAVGIFLAAAGVYFVLNK